MKTESKQFFESQNKKLFDELAEPDEGDDFDDSFIREKR